MVNKNVANKNEEVSAKKIPEQDRVVWQLFLSLFLIGAAFLSVWWAWSKPLLFETKNSKLTQEPIISAQEAFFGNLEIEAKSYIIYDPQTKEVISGKDINTARPLASLTKVMTALTAAKLVSLQDTTIVVNEDNLGERNRNENDLRPYSLWKLRNLLNLTLISSSNEGARAIANTISAISAKDFIAEMNREALDIGLEKTNFFNATGLDLPSGKAGAYGSPKDMAKLFAYLLQNQPDLLSATRQNNLTETSLENNHYQASNTNLIASQIPGLLASKTGYTQAAGGNLAVVANLGLNRPIIFVVMGSSQAGRFDDMTKLITKTQDYLIQTSL